MNNEHIILDLKEWEFNQIILGLRRLQDDDRIDGHASHLEYIENLVENIHHQKETNRTTTGAVLRTAIRDLLAD